MQCLISVAVLEHLHLPLHPDTQRDSHALSIDVAVPAGGEWCGGKCYMFDSTQYCFGRLGRYTGSDPRNFLEFYPFVTGF